MYYLTPDFSKLLDINLWRDIFGQLFFSLSLGLGIIVGYSRYTKQDTNIVQAMIWVAIGDFAVSFISGAAIFGCLAHMSEVQHIPFESILTTDSTFEIGFVLFPQILKTFGPTLSPIIGTLFFFCIFIAGMTGVFSIVESIVGNVEVEFKLSRVAAVSVVMSILMGIAFFFCMGNASHLLDALAPMVLGTNMIISGLCLIIAFVYFQPVRLEDRLWTPKEEKSWLVCSLKYFAPIVLSIILIGNLWEEALHLNLAVAVRWAWLLGASMVSIGIVAYTSRAARKVIHA